jgi:hypothetical protein
MKYLVVEDFSGQAIPIIFPERIRHDEMREQLPYAKVLSAGLVELHDGHFVCFGGSAELSLSAREEDQEIVASRFRPRKR